MVVIKQLPVRCGRLDHLDPPVRAVGLLDRAIAVGKALSNGILGAVPCTAGSAFFSWVAAVEFTFTL